jgi:F-type H+-transporting ATPase subunit alpha
VVLIYAGTRGYLDKVDVNAVGRFESELRAWLRSKKADLLSAIVAKKDIKADGIEDKIKAALDEFSATFA